MRNVRYLTPFRLWSAVLIVSLGTLAFNGCQNVPTPQPAIDAASARGAQIPTTEPGFNAFLDTADPVDHGNTGLQITKTAQSITSSDTAKQVAGTVPWGSVALSGINLVLAGLAAWQANSAKTNSQNTHTLIASSMSPPDLSMTVPTVSPPSKPVIP